MKQLITHYFAVLGVTHLVQSQPIGKVKHTSGSFALPEP